MSLLSPSSDRNTSKPLELDPRVTCPLFFIAFPDESIPKFLPKPAFKTISASEGYMLQGGGQRMLDTGLDKGCCHHGPALITLIIHPSREAKCLNHTCLGFLQSKSYH